MATFLAIAVTVDRPTIFKNYLKQFVHVGCWLKANKVCNLFRNKERLGIQHL